MMQVQPGSRAIPFTLPSTEGEVSVDGLKGRPFLLSFYSLAFTPV